MSTNQNDRQRFDIKARDALNISLFLARTWSTSIEVFIHRATGERYLAGQALAVFLLAPIYATFWQGYDLRPMLWFMPAYFGACVVNRLQQLARAKRGEHCHSYYTGWPRFLGPKATVTELTMKRFWEPLITLLLGCVCRDWYNAPLGTYFMIGGGCLFVSVNAAIMTMQMRTLDLNDATIEQEIIAERFRDMRGERW